MPQFTPEAVARYEQMIRKDPKSQIFAPLAEAYRLEERLNEAHKLCAEGVRLHPQFASGWVTFGKILRDEKRLPEALDAFTKAVTLAPENLLGLQLLGETHLELRQVKEALRLFKRILFLNPQAEKARKIVTKLESVTADEYGDDVFAMTKLTPLSERIARGVTALARPDGVFPELDRRSTSGLPLVVEDTRISPDGGPQSAESSKALLRVLSLIDAFIVRNDIARAAQLLEEARQEFGDQAEIAQRGLLLQRRRSSQLGSREEMAEPLSPLDSREEAVRNGKIRVLEAVMRRIEEWPARHQASP